VRAIQAARRPLHTVQASATLDDVARLMASEGLRAVVVERDDGSPAGIVSERDLVVRGLARRLPPSATVDVVMTPEPVTAEASGPLSAAYRILREFGVRQIPLVEHDKVVAVLELDDLADEMASELMAGKTSCPKCRANWLSPVTTSEEEINFLCLQCRSCWHLDGGALVRTDTQACAGCPDQRFCRFPAIDHRKDMERFPSPEKPLARS
jgi:CBS domain-containing protein